MILLQTNISKLGKLFIKFFIVIAFAALILTYNRGAILAGVAAILTFIYFKYFYQKERLISWRWILGAFIFLVVGISTYIIAQPFISKQPDFFFGHFSWETLTKKNRLMMWESGFKGLLDRPLLGTGPENYYSSFNKYIDPRYLVNEEWVYYSHNIFLECLFTEGILGFLAFLAVQYCLVKNINENQFINHKIKYVLFAWIVSIWVRQLFVFDEISGQLLIIVLYAFSLTGIKPLSYLSVHPNWKPVFPLISIGALFFLFSVTIAQYNLIKGFRETLMAQEMPVNQKFDKLDQIFAKKPFDESMMRMLIANFYTPTLKNAALPQKVKNVLAKKIHKILLLPLEEQPTRCKHWTIAGEFTYQFLDAEHGLSYINEALRLSPNKTKLLLHKVCALQKLNKPKEAARILDLAKSLNPEGVYELTNQKKS